MALVFRARQAREAALQPDTPTEPDAVLAETARQNPHGFMNDLDGRHSTPPVDLDPALTSVAVMLAAEMTPPEPSARFLRRLDQRLTASLAASNNHHQAVLPATASTELTPQTTPADWRVAAVDPRRSRISEIARLAAAVLAIMFIGSGLIFMCSEREDELAGPGIGVDPPAEGEIVVSWDPHGGEDYKLFVVHAATGEIRKLTPGPAEVDGISERYGSWSTDGQQVVFVREDDGQSDIYVMDAHPGTEPKNLTSSLFRDTAPMWSPDGSQIVWVSSYMEQGEVANIHVMDADGSKQRQLTHLDTGAFSPAWSPGGTQIAYVVRSMDFLQVWLMDADGGNPHAITEIDESFTIQESFTPRLAWSPDGQSIAFGTGSTIKTVSSDGSNMRDLREGDLVATSNPAWSANGQRLAYAFVNPETGFNGIALAGTSGMHVENWRPPDVEYVDAPSWSPDGTLIAFYGGSGDEEVVWELRVNGSMGAGHRILVGSGIDHLSPPNWRPIAGETPPTPASTPTPQVVATPVDQPSPTPEILTEPPRASLTYEDQTQTHGANTYCWPEPLRSGELRLTCSEADRGPPDLPAIHVPAGASLSFEVEGGHAVTPLGAAAVRLIPYPEPSTTGLMFDFPGTGIPFEQGPDGTFIIADVPDGDYSFEVGITMDIHPGNQGNANYAFRVIVGDPDAPPPEEPARFQPILSYEDQSQTGIFAYGCNWEGDPVCVDPGGLLIPSHTLNVPEGATMSLTFSNPADIEIIRFDGRIHLTDGAEVRPHGDYSELLYPAPHEETPIMWGSLENLNVVADLPPGHYVLAVTYHAAQGSGTYGFHVRVLPVEEPWRVPDTIGTIVEAVQRGVDLSILIVEHPENPNAGDQMYITVRPNSRVFELTTDGVQRRAVDDLQGGMRVTVAITGAIASSYPGYAYGSEVVIVRTETDGFPDPDDLVTMTFRHSQITGFSAIPGGDSLYVAYSVTGGSSGEIVLCANDDPGAETCASGYEFRAEAKVPRGAELNFTIYRLSRDNPDEPEVVKQGREVVDADMITRSWYRYGASNPGGY